jgi:hypothetical protein
MSKSSALRQSVNDYENEVVNRVRTKVKESRDRVASYHSECVLDASSYSHRGVNESFLDVLNCNNVNAHYNDSHKSIEETIIELMKNKAAI